MFQTSSQWEGDKEPCSSPTLFIDCMHVKLVRNKPVHVHCRYTRIIQSTLFQPMTLVNSKMIVLSLYYPGLKCNMSLFDCG